MSECQRVPVVRDARLRVCVCVGGVKGERSAGADGQQKMEQRVKCCQSRFGVRFRCVCVRNCGRERGREGIRVHLFQKSRLLALVRTPLMSLQVFGLRLFAVLFACNFKCTHAFLPRRNPRRAGPRRRRLFCQQCGNKHGGWMGKLGRAILRWGEQY